MESLTQHMQTAHIYAYAASISTGYNNYTAFINTIVLDSKIIADIDFFFFDCIFFVVVVVAYSRYKIQITTRLLFQKTISLKFFIILLYNIIYPLI